MISHSSDNIAHKKSSFPLNIPSGNDTKSAGKLQIWSHLPKKFLMENLTFCAVLWCEIHVTKNGNTYGDNKF